MQTKLTSIGLFILFAVASLFGATNETAWKVGVASIVITPDQPMWMAGYARRTNASQGKATELYAKALALEDALAKSKNLVW